MDKDNSIKLCLAAYQVTNNFPIKEPLKILIREKANEVLTNSILFFTTNPVNFSQGRKKIIREQILSGVEVLSGYFEVAEKQKWVSNANFFVLQREYNRLKEEMENLIFREKPFQEKYASKENPIKEELKAQLGKPAVLHFGNSTGENLKKERWKKILRFLEKKNKAQVWEFKKIFPEITKRTLRRDLDYLLGENLIERIGERNDTYYKIKVR